MGVALRAVADDGDGLAVEEGEVCVVVVVHGAGSYVAGSDPPVAPGARRGDVRAPGSATEPSSADVLRQARVDRVAQVVALGGRQRADAPRQASSRCRAACPTSRRGSRSARRSATCSTTMSVEARLLEQLDDALRVAEGEHVRLVGVGRLDRAHRDELGDRRRRPRVVLPGPPRRRARRGRRGAGRAASRAARWPGRRAACSPSARGRRRGRPSAGRSTRRRSRGTRRSSMPSSAARARACSTISSTTSELISVPPGSISSAARKPGVARAGGELEHAVAGLGLDRVDHPVRHRLGARPAGARGARPSRRPPPPSARGSSRGTARDRSAVTGAPRYCQREAHDAALRGAELPNAPALSVPKALTR